MASQRSSTRRVSLLDKQKGVQGSQFTSTDFLKVQAAREIMISMDGKGAWRDSVFVERLWRTINHEEVYLRAYACVSEARAGFGRYLGFYNSRRCPAAIIAREAQAIIPIPKNGRLWKEGCPVV